MQERLASKAGYQPPVDLLTAIVDKDSIGNSYSLEYRQRAKTISQLRRILLYEYNAVYANIALPRPAKSMDTEGAWN